MAMRQVLVVLWAMCLYQAESKRSSISPHLPSHHPESERDDDKPDSEASLLEEEKVKGSCYKHHDCPMCYLCSEHMTSTPGHCYKNTFSSFCR